MSHGHDPGPERILLVGFMAAGKSTVGPLLAGRLGWDFIDFDRRIRERTGRTPGEWIREAGVAAFRDVEAELTAELGVARHVVLAPGGGWVTRPELADRLGPGTVRVWLRVGLDEALRRAEADATDRPLLGAPDGRRARAAELLRSREALYAKAEIQVNVDGKEPGVIADEILRQLARDREDDERE